MPRVRIVTKDGRVYEAPAPTIGGRTLEVSVAYRVKTARLGVRFCSAIFEPFVVGGVIVWKQRPGKGQSRLRYVPKNWRQIA